MTIRTLTGTIHLWLGLLSGLVVFIVAVTGAMYVFQEEIETRLIHPERHFVAELNQSFALMSVWLSKANTAFAPYDSLIDSRNVYWYWQPGRTVSVGSSYGPGAKSSTSKRFLIRTPDKCWRWLKLTECLPSGASSSICT